MSSLDKPILFLDFDRTLFDTEQLFSWIGIGKHSGILELMSGKRQEPDYAQFLFSDTLSFLKEMRSTYRLVLLTFSVNEKFQRQKIRGSQVAQLFDDILITTKGKGEVAKAYCGRFHSHAWRHIFVDDEIGNIINMKNENPEISSILMDRTGERIKEINKADLIKADYAVENLDELKRCLKS